MQTQNYWKQFEETGRIEDYLLYKADDSQRSLRIAGCKSDYEGYYAGYHACDGDDTKTIPNGRI